MSEDEVLKIYKSIDALLEGHFILSSGLHSKMYLQSALVFSNTKIAELLCKSLSTKVKNLIDIDSIDLIVSPAMGGVIVGYELSRHLNKLNIFAERKDGVFSIRRGFKINEGQKVLVVEDIVTTGKSSLECFECINELGGEIVAEAALINRGGDSVNLGVPLITLANLDIPNYKPENLPEDLKNLPAIKPGSRPGK
ncbi:MAG: orotate phosphoribosyltransferase [Pelagibacterales bacterium]|nr:orotate phosphoribosyltransferase [Pelagibacterales bacterium]RCL81510.1 MAG: orotate phosphoribosyltransferase [Alphaproteobacteria bacterium]|tara:strand:+ start:448 stop:1035 length:588 start_codon:yes stop_codon:yes gene_type:complete